MNLLFFAQTTHHETAEHAAHHVAEHAQHAAAHAEHAEHGAPHIVNWVSLLAKSIQNPQISAFLTQYEKVIFTVIIIGIITLFFRGVYKKMSLIPSKTQLAVEGLVLFLDGLVCGVIGHAGRRYTPFVGSLFIYILVTNLFGLVPLQNSATAYITTTAPLALCVFFYVQYIGITKNGILGYLDHMAGSPRDAFGFVMMPLIFPLHILGEFAKPVSLMFRLYGNVMAGHILVAVFLGLGLGMLKGLHVPFGVPLHFPFLFLELMVGAIQAFVFALLSTVYIGMMLPHHDDHHEEKHGAHHEAAHH